MLIGKYLKEMSYPKLIDLSDFMTVQNSLWEIKVDHQTPTVNWFERKIICDCPAFQSCKQSLGLAVNFLFWDRFYYFWDNFLFFLGQLLFFLGQLLSFLGQILDFLGKKKNFWGKNLYFSGTFFYYSREKKFTCVTA